MHTVLVVFSTSVRIKTVNFGRSLGVQVGDSSFELNNIQDQVEVCDIMWMNMSSRLTYFVNKLQVCDHL